LVSLRRFLSVLICLIFSVLSTIEEYADSANESLYWMVSNCKFGKFGLTPLSVKFIHKKPDANIESTLSKSPTLRVHLEYIIGDVEIAISIQH
jgi:hypothetical protein